MARLAHCPPRSVTVPGTLRQRLVASALALAVIGLVLGGWFEYRSASRVGNVGDLSATATAAANAKVVQLTTFNGSASSASIFTGVTDHFRKTYTSQVGLFSSAVTSSKVVSRGTVDASGVVSVDPSRASVLVATSGSVSAAGRATQQRYFRFEVTLVRFGGAWLVDDVRFVE